MSNTKASASYKKKDGVLSLAPDRKNLIWNPDSETSPSSQVIISVESITNLQATPSTSAKVMIKVFVQQSEKAPVEQFVFTFNSPSDARLEATQLKDALTSAIQSFKTSTTADAENTEEQQYKETLARSHKSMQSRTDDDLKNDMLLQQAVLSSSPNLQKRFHEAVVEGNMSATQFWSTRTHLLRAHAAERSQSRGSYNVLATIKPKTEDSVLRVSLSRDQIHIIFEQHPLIKRVYDEVVPKLREDEFWRRLFMSKLYKKLKGEKIVATDSHDDVLDQYLKIVETDHGISINGTLSVPHIIDVNGNEENHSQRQGNRPDLTMRPNKTENVPIIRTLNDLSAKLLNGVTPVDLANESSDQEARNIADSRLTDLQIDIREQNILLKIRDHKQFLELEPQPIAALPKDSEEAAASISTILPRMVTNTLSSTITETFLVGKTYHRKAGETPHHPVESEDAEEPFSETASHLRAAAVQIATVLETHRSQLPKGVNRTLVSENSSQTSQPIFERILLTQATSTEFLRHFWDVFLSGDSKKTQELRHIVDSLKRSLERIEIIAKSAEDEKNLRDEDLKRQQEQRNSERKKHRKGVSDIGYNFVKRTIAPQERAINMAIARYQQALSNSGPNS